MIDTDSLKEDMEANKKELTSIGSDAMYVAKEIKKMRRELNDLKESIGTSDAEDMASGEA